LIHPGDGSGDAGTNVSSTACCVTAGDRATESAAGVVDLAMESSLLTPASSMWKLNKTMVNSKPPALAKVDPIAQGKRLTTADVGELMMTGDGILKVVDGGMSTSIGEVELMLIAGGESMATGDTDESMMIAGGESMVTGDADESMTAAGGESMATVNAVLVESR
jgi:hypothetical protein